MSATPMYLSAVDTAWFRMEASRNPVDITTLLLFEGPLDEARLRATLDRMVAEHPRFRRRVVDSRLGITPPHWEEERAFSIDAHISRRTLPAPGGEAAMEDLISELMSVPFDLSRSPWRLVIVDGLEEGTAIVSQIHHCMGDGFALVALLLSMTDSPPDLATVPKGNIYAEAPRPEHSWLSDAKGIAAAARDSVTALGHLLLLPFDPPTALRGKLSGRRRAAWSRPIPLGTVKEIAHKHGGKVNDVLMTALAGAFRRYLREHGRIDELPEAIRAIVPVNLRPPDRLLDEDHGNWFGLVFLDLPLDGGTRDDRMAALKRSMDHIKSSKEAIVSLGILNLLGRSPTIVDHVADEIFARKATVVVTNVPGPREPLSFAGSKVRDIMFWVPHPAGLACGASLLSYAGSVHVGVRTDVAVVSDPGTIARYFDEEIEAWAIEVVTTKAGAEASARAE